MCGRLAALEPQAWSVTWSWPTSTRDVHEAAHGQSTLAVVVLTPYSIVTSYHNMADKQSLPTAPTLSLYDDLLGSANPNATISAAPVLYKKDAEDDVKSKLAKIQQSLNAGQTT